MKKLGLLEIVCIVFVFCAATAIASPAQVLTTLHSFDSADGAWPYGWLMQATDGNFYGTTNRSGAGGQGTVFRITPSGTLTTLYSFGLQPYDGAQPTAGLVEATDGNFYGTTMWGGVNGYGTVFKITASGTLTTLYSFGSGNDGVWPQAGVVQATDGNFYGITNAGGAGYDCFFYCGTVFKITPGGTLTTLYNFCLQSGCPDGAQPSAGLVQASDGNFYGTTSLGGSSGSCSGFDGPGCGTVFKITPTGTLTTLHSFDSTDGKTPNGLVQATDGNFYGTTVWGGANGGGTVFRVTPGGTLTTLYSFCSQPNCTDGVAPVAELVQASDGNFYGATNVGGAYGWDYGSVFKITPSGTLTTLHSFDDTDGAAPQAGLVQASDGNFYGTTNGGGAYGYGTVFRLVSERPCFLCALQWKMK